MRQNTWISTKDSSNRLAKYIEINEINEDIGNRLKKYVDKLYIDEVQDIAGHDFDFLKSIAQASGSRYLNSNFMENSVRFMKNSRARPNRGIHSVRCGRCTCLWRIRWTDKKWGGKAHLTYLIDFQMIII